ncbi:ComF family protein [Streptomyces sp. SP18CS02]|uniref:ComF family protein n=1 Tax=Streptomyces sp. SP18CS02 TaxID=3002531 RepID=UPI003FCCED85
MADQTGLGARQRLVNMAGALEAVAGAERLMAGGRVLLVDDLMTTGASLVEAARALRAATDGSSAAFGQVGAAVVAAPLISFHKPELTGKTHRCS